jgi:hypothetical protein
MLINEIQDAIQEDRIPDYFEELSPEVRIVTTHVGGRLVI